MELVRVPIGRAGDIALHKLDTNNSHNTYQYHSGRAFVKETRRGA